MTAPEFSYPLAVDEIPNKGLRLKIEATPEECAALAKRFDLISLASLKASFRIAPLAGGPMLHADGRIEAELSQPCVVSGEPVAERIDTDIAMEFAPPSMIEENVELTLDDSDPAEPIENGMIDLGEIAAQQMALALNLYPRAAGAELGSVLQSLPEKRRQGIEIDAPSTSPFAALQGLSTGTAGKKNDEA